MILKSILLKTWAYFASNFMLFLHHLFSVKYATASIVLTGWTYAIREAFERDHAISFSVTWPIIALVFTDFMVQMVGVVTKKTGYKLRTSLEDFMSKLILYWLFIKVVNWLCVTSYLVPVCDSLLWFVIVHQSANIYRSIQVIKPGMLPKINIKKIFKNETL